MRAWLFQDYRQKQKLGENAPWSVGWIDPDGKKRSKRIGSRSRAEKFARKTEGELAAGTYQTTKRKSWAEFRKEYEQRIAAGMSPAAKMQTLIALKHFTRICKPARVDAIKTQTIDGYTAIRRTEKGAKPESLVAPATVNKELRHIKSVLRVAHEWGYTPTMPKVRMLKEPQKLVRYVTPDHFAKIYGACDAATKPDNLPCSAGDWWQALLMFCYMTGWRISEPLALRREDLDLDAGTAITRAADNKGKRDEIAPLHPIVIEHLRKILTFEPVAFPWYENRRGLWKEFHAIQKEAGIHLPCTAEHTHNDACHLYGFHDLRRAFATMNAEKLSANALQALMRHKSYVTTQRYINMARQLDRAVQSLHVPDLPEIKPADAV